MPFDENLANRVRESIMDIPQVEEKKMFGGLCFMVNEKMCVGIVGDDLMCRIDPEVYEAALEKRGCREMDFNGRPMKGFVFVSKEGMKTKPALEEWIKMALSYNKKAKSSKKKK